MATTEVQQALDEIRRKAESAEAAGDIPLLLEAIEQGALFLRQADAFREPFREWLKAAMLARVEPKTFYDRPYTKTTVLTIYNELREQHPELQKLPPGPRPRFI